jgi:hypothetical protein
MCVLYKIAHIFKSGEKVCPKSSREWIAIVGDCVPKVAHKLQSVIMV